MYHVSDFAYELAGCWKISTPNYEDHECTVTAYFYILSCNLLYWIKESNEISTHYSQFLLLFGPYMGPKDYEIVESPGP
jgi:hypothetical protein